MAFQSWIDKDEEVGQFVISIPELQKIEKKIYDECKLFEKKLNEEIEG